MQDEGSLKKLPWTNMQREFFTKAYESAYVNNHCNDHIDVAYFLNPDHFDEEITFQPRYKTAKLNPYAEDIQRNLDYMIDKRNNFGVLVMVDEQNMTNGFVLFKHLPNDTDILYLDIICTKAGYGTPILNAFIKFAKHINASSIRLHALFDVVRYYKRFNFDYGTNCNDRINSTGSNEYERKIFNDADEFIKENAMRIKEYNATHKNKIEFNNLKSIKDSRWLTFINYLQQHGINASTRSIEELSSRSKASKSKGCKNLIINKYNENEFINNCIDTGYDMILCLREERSTNAETSLRSIAKARQLRTRVLQQPEESFLRSKIRSMPRQHESVSVGRKSFHIIKPNI